MEDHKEYQETAAKQLLIIDDEKNMRHMLSALLTPYGFIIDTAADGIEGLQKVAQQKYDFILCDIKMPRMDGMTFLKKARDQVGEATVIMMSAYGTIETAVNAMKLGAYDYISKPFKSDEVYLTLKKAEEREQLKQENRRLKKRLRQIENNQGLGKVVGKSREMQQVFDLALRVGRYDTTVLIVGDSGTGKELIARAIHFNGKRKAAPMIPVNCGGIPATLLESELFGYRKGAFTGADRDKKGLFAEAHGGTLFLDEIAELPMPMQVKLLRALQEREIRPLGASKAKQVDVRIIAATSKNLEREVDGGHFREDLYYRINVLPIHLPPLKARMSDVPLLVHHFIEKYNRELGKAVGGFSSRAMTCLMEHAWPGNVRELENVIERAMVLAETDTVSRKDLPVDLVRSPDKTSEDATSEGYSLKVARSVLEERFIRKALSATNGNRTQAAKLLEISHPSLLSKMKQYHIT